MFAAKELSRGLASPTVRHWRMMKHCLRYLAGTSNVSLVIRPTHTLPKTYNMSTEIDCETDSDWAGDLDTRRSTSGYNVFWNGACIHSASKTQQTLALSSGEAELYAINSGTAECLALRNLMLELGFATKISMTLSTDSSTARAMTARVGHSKRTRHMHVRHLWIQELVTSHALSRKLLAH